jgi:hypothetical protein
MGPLFFKNPGIFLILVILMSFSISIADISNNQTKTGTNASRDPDIVIDPPSLDDPIHTAPNQQVMVELTITNNGPDTAYLDDITVSYISGGPPMWISLGTYPSEIVGSSSSIVEVTLNADAVLQGEADPSGWYAEIHLEFVDPSLIIIVPVHLTLASDFDMPESDTLHTNLRRLMAYNTGRLGGGNDGASLDVIGDCDADYDQPNGDMYLFDASPMIAWNDGSENLTYTSIYSQEFTDSDAFRPQSPLYIYNDYDPDFAMAMCTLSTNDSLFGVDITYWVPKDGNNFIIARYEFHVWTGFKGADEVYVGMILDWNIPSDELVNNQSGEEPDNTVWQRGVQTSTDDEVMGCPIQENERFGGISLLTGPPLNAWTAEVGTMSDSSGMNTDYIYNRMSGFVGVDLYTGGGEDTVADLYTGMTFDAVDLSSDNTYSYVFALVTTNSGLPNLILQVEAAETWTSIVCGPICFPGDANGDWSVNVADAVYIINYVFKGGPPPPRWDPCNGDANCDCECNVGDAVHIINYVFKGGQPPCSSPEWVETCY